MPWAVKLVAASLAGLLLAVLSGRWRADGKVLAGPFFIACAAVTALLHQLVWEDPGLIAILGGFLVGFAIFLAAPARKAAAYVALGLTLAAILALVLTLYLRLPPRETRLAIARIRQSGGSVQQSDNPGTTYRDEWLVAFEPQGIDDDQLLRIAPDLRKLPKLWLFLSNCSVGDRGLAGLASAGNLIWLDLDSTQVTDAGLIHLSQLRGLERLNLARTRVSDTGLRSLSQLANLQTLLLHHTAVTENGVCELVRSLPDCDVRYGDPSVPAPANRENSLPAVPNTVRINGEIFSAVDRLQLPMYRDILK